MNPSTPNRSSSSSTRRPVPRIPSRNWLPGTHATTRSSPIRMSRQRANACGLLLETAIDVALVLADRASNGASLLDEARRYTPTHDTVCC